MPAAVWAEGLGSGQGGVPQKLGPELWETAGGSVSQLKHAEHLAQYGLHFGFPEVVLPESRRSSQLFSEAARKASFEGTSSLTQA